MTLTDTEIKKTKPLAKDYQMGDSNGLSLVVRKKGAKAWRYEFRLNGKKDKYHYGNYPEISLDNARKVHLVARQLVEFGKHPATLLDNPESKRMIIDGHTPPYIPPISGALSFRLSHQDLFTSRPIPVHGLRTTDLSREPARH